ncbi:hypothetical protein N7481_006758 [Penicillium waksmanii]|uniref:uncharacterized protein n=1 Tax=Penicillium waksmanii TaxID=69791 RepID=UPI002547F8E7|nr:uncharacterized protein N7481_006758 [Penicillium waksmanii]KAJ5984659.1 hypothetical protein N7481_006758 [Penicillium waksmanii]
MEILPAELLLQITLYLPESALASLSLTNRYLHHLTNPVLYDHNGPRRRGSAAPPPHEASTRHSLQQGPRIAQFGRLVPRRLQDFRPHPISLAVEKGHAQLVRFMIDDRGVNPNTTTPEWHTLLALTAIHGHPTLSEYLLRVGARQSIPSFIGQRPVWLAAFQGHADVVNVLLSAATPPRWEDDGLSIKELMTEAVSAAVLAGQGSVLQVLFTHGVDVNVFAPDFSESPLHIAARCGHRELVSWLLAYGADPNLIVRPRCSTAPLTAAVIAGHTDLVSILIPGTAMFHRTRALAFAVAQQNRPLIQTLLAGGAPPHFGPEDIRRATYAGNDYEDWVQPLLAAVHTKDLKLVELLLDAGADVNVPCREIGSEQGKIFDRVLFWAVEAADETIVELLLARGANPEMSDMMGCSPLVYAVEGGYEAVLRVLLAYGANPLRAVNYSGEELWSLAQTKESIRVLLVEAEARWKGTGLGGVS